MASMKVRVRTKMIVVIMHKPRLMDAVYKLQRTINKRKGEITVIEGEEVLTLFTNQEFEGLLVEKLHAKIIKINKQQVLISLIFDSSIETTPGVVTYIYGLLADRGINIREEMSCWTDILIIIDEKDLLATMEALKV